MSAPAVVRSMGATPLTRTPGVYPGLAMDEYHALEAASNSRLTKLRRSPAHLKAYLSEPSGDTKATRIGRAAHTTVLEPETFDATFIVASQCMANKKDGYRCGNQGTDYYGDLFGWRCGLPAHSNGLPLPSGDRIALPQSDYVTCCSVRNAVFAHRSASALLGARQDVELSMFWEDALTGVTCKGRLDCLSPNVAGGAIIDLKTTRSAKPDEFSRLAYEHGYHRQAAFYLDGAKALGIPAEHFIIIAVEKDAPFAVSVHRLDEATIDAGRRELRVLLDQYARCLERNEWPGYPDRVLDLSLPAYAWGQVDALAYQAEVANG